MSLVALFKLLLVGLLFFIIINLAKALIHMVRNTTEQQERKPMSHYLGKRVMLSAVVVILLLLALSSGLITPNPTPYG